MNISTDTHTHTHTDTALAVVSTVLYICVWMADSTWYLHCCNCQTCISLSSLALQLQSLATNNPITNAIAIAIAIAIPIPSPSPSPLPSPSPSPSPLPSPSHCHCHLHLHLHCHRHRRRNRHRQLCSAHLHRVVNCVCVCVCNRCNLMEWLRPWIVPPSFSIPFESLLVLRLECVVVVPCLHSIQFGNNCNHFSTITIIIIIIKRNNNTFKTIIRLRIMKDNNNSITDLPISMYISTVYQQFSVQLFRAQSVRFWWMCVMVLNDRIPCGTWGECSCVAEWSWLWFSAIIPREDPE